MRPRLKSVLVSVTEKCHVGCAHCGFIGSIREREPEPEELADWVGQVCEYGIPLVIFTGGEPFERLDCLQKGVAAAESVGTRAAVFTSSFWATTLSNARSNLDRLPGLKHLYLSSDPFHQRRVPYENVFNAIDAAIELSIPKISVVITYTNDEELKDVRSHYAEYGDSINFCEERVIPNPNFSRRVLLHQGALRAPRPEEYPCNCEIGTPIVNPNGDVFSCHVGKAAAHRDLRHLPYFLGNLHEAAFADIMVSAALRPDYQFLRTHGARGVAALFSHEPALIAAVGRDGFTTECDMCFSTLKIPEGRAALDRYVSQSSVRDEIDMRLALIMGEYPLPEGAGRPIARDKHEMHDLVQITNPKGEKCLSPLKTR
jgi:organic radical activating enzyme